MSLRSTEHRHLKRRAMTGGMLAMTMFCCVSAGPFGLEPAISAAGPGIALLLIAVLPILWALPDALTTAELAPAIPEEGGYIVWVRRAMGPVAGFLNAWWTWIYALLDAAIYPVYFTASLSGILELYFGVDVLRQNDLARWAVCLVVIAAFTWLNARGTRLVGFSGVAMAVIIIVPFALLVVYGASQLLQDPRPIPTSLAPPSGNFTGALAAGMAIVMWNYLGWDQLSTIAEEVDRPERAYPRAIFLCVPLVAAVYLFPVLIGLAFVPNPEAWQEGAWPRIADTIGGPWLAFPMLVASLASPVALFTASLLASSRVPFVMAEQGYLPKALVQIHPRFGTPVRALLVSAVVFAILAWKSFAELVALNVLMYSAALCLESAALIVLRVKEPQLPRPFKIPGGHPVLALVFLLPVSVAIAMTVFSVLDEGWEGQISSVAALASGPAVYFGILAWRKLRRRRGA